MCPWVPCGLLPKQGRAGRSPRPCEGGGEGGWGVGGENTPDMESPTWLPWTQLCGLLGEKWPGSNVPRQLRVSIERRESGSLEVWSMTLTKWLLTF